MQKTRVFADTNVILEAFRTNCWKAISSHFAIETVEKCVEETLTGNPGDPRHISVPPADLNAGLAAQHPVTRKELASLVLRREAIAIADDEAVRILQLARFRTEEMLEHAYAAIEFDAHAELDSFDRTADAMTRLVWLRAKAPKVFDQIETIYLTHHFHGHKKFLGFTVRDGDGRDFVWTEEVATKLHEGVGEILGLDDEAKASCEVIHFEMDDGDGDAKRRLHYLVVYPPMQTAR